MDLPVDVIARVCHEANRALQAGLADPAVSVAPAWDSAPQEYRDSSIAGVRGILAGNSPEQSHASWCSFKTSAGWVYGPVKDDVARTHPCLVPYEDLPARDKVKDHLFSAIVRTLAAGA